MNFYLPLIIFCFSTSITPGPNNLMIMMSGARYGVRRSLPHYFGICIGFNVMVAIVGMGLGEIFIKIPSLHLVIKYAGAAYMLYLALKIILSSTELETPIENKKPLSFIRAALFQWVNAKGWIMAVGIFSAYSVSTMNMFNQALLFAGIFFIIGLPCIGMWLISGVAVSRYLKSAKHMFYFNVTSGLLLIASIALMLLEGN